MYIKILNYLFLFIVCFCTISNAQNKDKEVDSLKPNLLETIVITGQYKPQSIDKSVYRVEIIDKVQIRSMAVTNVAELLKQQLNIEIENSKGSGRSKIRVLGLDSQYTKILMDNIPIAGDQSMGSDVDLSTISLDDVERVEIVKGAMGVEYGSNSISGVINIITKKTASDKTDIRIELQEESVRDEYNLKMKGASKGKHIQRVTASRRIFDKFSVGGSVSRESFEGYWGEFKGGGIMRKPTKKRGYEWSPKLSWNGNAYLSYSADKFSVFYKVNYFNSTLTNYAHNTYWMELKDEKLVVNTSTNSDFNTLRWNHHLNVRGDFWKDTNYNFDFSFQKNSLQNRRQAINLFDNSVIDKINGIPGSNRLKATDWEKYNQSHGIYSKGNIYKPAIPNKLDVFIGYELDNTKGNQGATLYFMDVLLNGPVEKTLFTGGIYVSAEWFITPKIMIRPGFRLNYNSQVKMRTNQSLTTRYRFNDKNDLRLILGTSTRFPNYDELYMWFVDNIHDYRGNPDLKPESGMSAEMQWSHHREFFTGYYLETNISTMFQKIEDRIVSAIIDGGNVLTGRNSFINENNYISWLNQLDVKLGSEKMQLSAGFSLLGNQGDSSVDADAYSEFLWNSQINSQFTYVLPLDFRVSLFYRYVGKQPIYTFFKWNYGKNVNKPKQKILNLTDSYNKLDINVAKSFFNKKLDLNIGVKNLFDVTDIHYKPVDYKGKGYPQALIPRVQNLYYGRSYFARVTYKI